MKVHFRKFEDGQIIALFPDQKWSDDGSITSYMHIGQHGGASPDLISELPKATVKEYFPLMGELRNIGYGILKVQS